MKIKLPVVTLKSFEFTVPQLPQCFTRKGKAQVSSVEPINVHAYRVDSAEGIAKEKLREMRKGMSEVNHRFSTFINKHS